MCVPQNKAHDRMRHILCAQLLYLMLVFSLCSFIQHARHGQRWDDNPGGIQTCNCLILWIQVLNPVINLRQPGMFTAVSTASAMGVLVISVFISVIGLLSAGEIIGSLISEGTRSFVVLKVLAVVIPTMRPGGGGAVITQRGTGEGDSQKHR